MRVRVQPDALAARNISLDELTKALAGANANTPVGTLEGPAQTLTLQANKQLRNAAEFGEVIVISKGGNTVRLKDVADRRGQLRDRQDRGDLQRRELDHPGDPATARRQHRQGRRLGEARCSSACRRSCRSRSGSIAVNDRSVSIRDALHDVTLTMMGTIVLVVLVIFLFLRRFVATAIPTLSLPVSLIGAVSLLWAFGYTIDNISLLGLTLAVGLVVDDAIVMLENIMRHVEHGEDPFQAALRGSREVGFTIISISSSLVAVFIPIFFMPGVIGLLFHEFAVIVALAIVASAFVSLTLVPMLASRFLKDEAHKPSRRAGSCSSFERGFDALLAAYTRTLDVALAPSRLIVLGVALLTFLATAWLFITIPKGFFPQEDIGQIQHLDRSGRGRLLPGDGAAAGRASPRSCAPTRRWRPSIRSTAPAAPGGSQNVGRMFINLKPRNERPPMKDVVENLRKKLREVAGISVYMRPIQNLQLGGRPSKAQYQYILQSVQAGELNDWALKLQEPMRADPMFRDVTSDSQLKGLQASLKIDRDRANTLGVTRSTASARRSTAPSASVRSRPSIPPSTATR